MELGKRIKEYREKNNIPQDKFALEIDVTQPYLSHLENGKLKASERLEKRILKIIGQESSKKIIEGNLEIDNVNEPSHYQLGTCNVESIDIIKKALGEKGFIYFCLGNILKYLIRAEKKNKLEDYKKANKYLDWIIEKEKVGYFISNYEYPEELAADLGTKWDIIFNDIVSKNFNDIQMLRLFWIFRNIILEDFVKAKITLENFIKEYGVDSND